MAAMIESLPLKDKPERLAALPAQGPDPGQGHINGLQKTGVLLSWAALRFCVAPGVSPDMNCPEPH